MNEFDQLDEAQMAGLDDLQLEVTRLWMVRTNDNRLELALRHLVVRGLSAITRVCEDAAAARGLTAEQRAAAFEDASVRLTLRLGRAEALPSVGALAAQLAADCIAAQHPEAEPAPKLVPRRPQLRVVNDELGKALREGRVRRNDGKSS
jgi:hypothetical protein